MTYEVDFEKSTDIGDARYYLVRIGRKTTVFRQWLKGQQPDPCCRKEEIFSDQIPKQLVDAYNILQNGGMPTVV